MCRGFKSLPRYFENAKQVILNAPSSVAHFDGQVARLRSLAPRIVQTYLLIVSENFCADLWAPLAPVFAFGVFVRLRRFGSPSASFAFGVIVLSVRSGFLGRRLRRIFRRGLGFGFCLVGFGVLGAWRFWFLVLRRLRRLLSGILRFRGIC